MDNCKQRTNSVEFGINIIIQMTFIFIILGLFFMLYVTKLTEKVINYQFSEMINKFIIENYNKLTSNNEMSLNDKYLDILLEQYKKSGLMDSLIKYYNTPTKEREEHNNGIKDNIYTVMILLVLAIILSVIICKALCFNIPIFNMLGENVIIFLSVGIVEILFFIYIISKYIPIKPSFLSTYLKESIIKQLN